MKMLRNKKTIHKMIISLIILILFNFIFPVYSRADWGDFGGTLFNPISKLICGIGDAFICILQEKFLPGSPEAVAKKKPIDFITEQLSDRVNAIIEKNAARYSTGQPVTEEEKKQMENELQTALRAREANEKAAYITSSDNVGTWIIGTIVGANDDKYAEQVIPCIIYSPAAIFANMVPALDVNFINPSVIYNGGSVEYELDSNDVIKVKSYTPNSTATSNIDDSNSAYVLQGTIATWYKALRNIAIVGLLSVLVYIAIRIILSTTAGETAKYKSMLKDWVVAMCILFFMHYMMAFLLKSSEMLTNLFVSNGVITQKVEDLKIDAYISNIRSDVEANSGNLGMQFGYTVMYVVLVFYTLIFTWKYIKRLIYLAFLTLISPMVALTYPIDKIKDGSAQAFNKWFKEYTFNVLIQPIHMLLYTILITSASSLAEDNMVYAIVALGFMLEAEKIIKDFFGLQTQRGEGAGAITGGAMFGAAAGLVQKGLGLLPSGSGGSGGSGKSGGSDGGKTRFNDRDSDSDASKPLDAFLDGNGDNGLNETESGGILPEEEHESLGNSNSSEELPKPPPSYQTDFFKKAAEERQRKQKEAERKAAEKQIAAAIKAEQRAKDIEAKRKKAEEARARKAAGRAENKQRRIKNFASSPTGKRLKSFGQGASDLAKFVGTSKLGRGLKTAGKFTGKTLAGAGVLAGKAGWGALKFGGRTLRGVGTVAGRFVGRNGIKMAKFAGRTALKGVGAATLGTIGLAAGLASDNDADIIKYAGFGLTAGAAAGGQLASSAESLYGTLKSGEEQIQEDFEQGYYGNDYEDKALNPRLDREWKQDKDVQAYYKKKYGSEYRQKMKESLVMRKAGITDQDDIDTALKLVKGDVTAEQAANIVKFTKGVTRTDMLNSQKWENMQRLATKMVGGDTPQNAEKVKKIMQLVNQRFKLDADWNPSERGNNQNS